jgi:uncharacterized membrane protein YfcA
MLSPWWSIVCLAVLLIGVTKSGFGSGVGLMIVPMMALAMSHIPGYSPAAALGLLLPLLILGDVVAVYQYRHLFSLSIVKHLLPGTLLGLVVGGLLLWYLHSHAAATAAALIRIEIGCEAVALVSLYWWRLYRGVQTKLLPEPLRSHLTGCSSAISSTLAHAAGPLVAMYLLPLRLDRQLYVGTGAIYFFLLNTAKLPAYYLAGMFHHASPLFALRFLPLLLIGALLGRWLNRRMSAQTFTRLVYAVTFALGWYCLYDGITALLKAHQ